MTRLKVVHIITGLGTGGAERLLLDMNATFDRSRFDVRLVSITSDLAALDIYGYNGTDVAVFDLGADRLRAFARLRAYLRQVAPDVIHAHMFHALIAGFAASRLLPHPPAIVFTSHLNQYALARAAATRMLKRWRAADIIFAAGQHPELNAGNTFVIPNGVKVPSVPPPRRAWAADGPLRLLAVGRIADQKDPLGMVLSFKDANLPRATLDFIGDGPLMPRVRALVDELGLAARVTLHGVRSDVSSFFERADIFVMHSKYEGMPIALLEAAAQAMPVVATPVGAVADVLGEDRGVLAASADFAARLVALAQNPVEAIAMGQRLHAYALTHYSIGTTTASHEQIYEAVARR